MGKGVFSNPDGCGRGEGIVHLRITYTPFNMFLRHPADSVTVRLTSPPDKERDWICPVLHCVSFETETCKLLGYGCRAESRKSA